MRAARTIHTALCDLLQCDYPLLLAGMDAVSHHELVAAVANAGGFGMLGMAHESPGFIRGEIEATRRLTDRPFAVNLVPSLTPGELLKKQLDACIDSGVHGVCLVGKPNPDMIRRLRRRERLVLCQVGAVEEALAAQEAGAQIVIAQGCEAGGPVRGSMGLLALLEALHGRLRLPVVAAGGIVSGRGLAACLALGAEGVQLGSLFLATRESRAPEQYKTKIVEATNPHDVHISPLDDRWPSAPATGQGPFGAGESALSKKSLQELELLPLNAGQSAYLINSVTSARAPVNEMVEEAGDLIRAWRQGNEALDLWIDAGQSDPAAASGDTASPACLAGRLGGDYLGTWPAERLAEAACRWVTQMRLMLAGLALGRVALVDTEAGFRAQSALHGRWVLVEEALRRLCLRSGGTLPERRILAVEEQLRTARALPSRVSSLTDDLKAAINHVADPTQGAILGRCVRELEASFGSLPGG